MRRGFFGALAVSVTLAAMADGALADPDPTIPASISEKIAADLSRADLDATATDASKYIGQTVADNFKNTFASVKNLGQSQYIDLIYSRDYGHTMKDIIYLIGFDKAFLFVRLVWHEKGGGWQLSNLQFKTETDLPFPPGWEHIYPK